jgi:hypothetical protein
VDKIKIAKIWSVPYNKDHYENWSGVVIRTESVCKVKFKRLYEGENLESYRRECSKSSKKSNSLSYHSYEEGIVIPAI